MRPHTAAAPHTKQSPDPRPASNTPPLSLASIPLPRCLSAPEWITELKHHPNRTAVDTAIDGIRNGVRLQFTGERNRVQHCNNLPSANEQPEAISSDLAKEVSKGRMAGPFAHPPVPNLICSPVGTVPKKDSDEYRRIHHLSWPRGASVNSYISDMPLEYTSFDHAIRMVRRIGPGARLAKIDVKSAFRCVAVHPSDRHLLGIQWLDNYYVDLCLPFGLKSSPALWEQFAEFAEWIATTNLRIRFVCHYVDDFLIGGAPDSDECQRSVDAIVQLFGRLGIPINTDKFAAEGAPTTVIKFLGIMINTATQRAYIDEERVQAIRTALDDWLSRKTCTLTELQSLIGTLAFASKVVPAGRSFIRRMIDLTKSVKHKRARRRREPIIQITTEFRRDTNWWRAFISKWNGVGIWLDDDWTEANALQLSTDASLTGYGAVCGNDWLHGRWTHEQLATAKRNSRESLPYLELLSLVLAASTFGNRWQGKRVRFHCDCMPVVLALRSGTSPQPAMMSLIRTLLFIAYTHSFTLSATHISSVANSSADVLSRVQDPSDVRRFRESHPTLCPSPTPCSPLPVHNW